MIVWRSNSPRTETTLLQEIERANKVVFPSEYIQLVENYDAGVPDKKIFTAKGRKHVLQRLISARSDKHPNIQDAMEWVESEKKIIPFALDPFGNLICFCFCKGTVQSIVYIETETGSMLPVSSSFSLFLSNLSRA